MNESKTKRARESQPAVNSKPRLASTQAPPLDKGSSEVVSHLTPRQQVELVSRLIEFIKTI